MGSKWPGKRRLKTICSSYRC